MEDLGAISTAQLQQMAVAARAQSNYVGAEAALREVVRREPRNGQALMLLTLTLRAQGARREALAMARKASAAAPKDLQVQQALASTLMMNGQMEAATRVIESLLKAMPDHLDLLASYATGLERIRRPKDARKAVGRVLELDPTNCRGLILLGQLEGAAGNLDAAVAAYERVLETATDMTSKGMAWHRLGAIRERQSRWDEAFDCHDRGNRAQMGTSVARHASEGPAYPLLDKIFSEDRREMVAEWAQRDFGGGPPDPVFLVGFPRSGTTLTEQVLHALPGTITTDEEPVLESARLRAADLCNAKGAPTLLDALDQLTDEEIVELRRLYWESVARTIGPEAAASVLFVDKQPLRFIYLALLNRIFPRSKIIFVIRDPRDCCLSCFFQDFAPFGPMARSTTLEGIGDLYAEVMTFWMRARTKISLPYLEVRYEDMVADFEPHARRLVEFVGREWTDDVLRFHEKAAGRAIRTPSFRAVTQKINTRAVGKWAHYETHLGPLIERVRPFLEPLGYEE